MINIIPEPSDYESKDGFFTAFDDLAVKSDFRLALLDCPRREDGSLIIIKDSSLEKEEYVLDISQSRITVKASAENGAYYALQSLRQLCGYELGIKSAPCCVIRDKPRFKWRGLQLDESRHFFGRDEVKRFLDNMFMMKLNVFHWHLTDDQGWRIEIKKYPLLTEKGSVREYTQVNGWHSSEIKNGKYGGYYTHEDIREIVSYANERCIDIVPEIDFPAHSASAIAAYPWLACRELFREVPGYFGSQIPEKKLGIMDWNRPVCPGKDRTLDFIFDVIDEVCELFPFEYFHIGGDEAPKEEWEECPCCQQRIKDNNLKNEEDLQGWLNNQIFAHLRQKGKKLIGWNEILKAGNIDRGVIAQYWTARRDKNAERFVNSGGTLIMSNHHSFYFDMPYGQYPLKYTYDYKPEKFGVNKKNVKNVLGVEGENWTEWTDSAEMLDCRLHPRMEALAEVAWTPDSKKDWDGFLHRLDGFKPFYDYLGINYAVDSVSMPKGAANRIKIQKKFYRGDTHFEVKLNKKLKAQGER